MGTTDANGVYTPARDEEDWDPEIAGNFVLFSQAITDLADHGIAADPHPGYQRESQRAVASGYASLDSGTKVPIAQLPTGTSSTTVALGNAAAGLDSAHVAASDPHPVYLNQGALFDATAPAAIGAAAVGTAGTAPHRDHVHATGAGTPSTQASGDSAATGSGPAAAMTDHKHAFPNLITQTTFAKQGPVGVSTGTLRWYNDSGRTLTFVSTRASVGTAPTGAALTVDVNVDGTTIFTTQGSRPSIAISGTTDQGDAPDVTTIAASSYLTVDVDQVGSTVAGSDLTVQVFLKG